MKSRWTLVFESTNCTSYSGNSMAKRSTACWNVCALSFTKRQQNFPRSSNPLFSRVDKAFRKTFPTAKLVGNAILITRWTRRKVMKAKLLGCKRLRFYSSFIYSSAVVTVSYFIKISWCSRRLLQLTVMGTVKWYYLYREHTDSCIVPDTAISDEKPFKGNRISAP